MPNGLTPNIIRMELNGSLSAYCFTLMVYHSGEIIAGETAEGELVVENKGVIPAVCTFQHADARQELPFNHELLKAPNYGQFYTLLPCTSDAELEARVDDYCTLYLRNRESRQSGAIRYSA